MFNNVLIMAHLEIAGVEMIFLKRAELSDAQLPSDDQRRKRGGSGGSTPENILKLYITKGAFS